MRFLQRSLTIITTKLDGISWKLRCLRNFLSSVLFNFTYLPFNQARHLPIWVTNLHFKWWSRYGGKIIIDTPNIYYRMIKMGVSYNYWFPDGGINLQVDGTIIFKGKCIIGNNSTVYVKSGSTLTIGENVLLSANNKVICECGITIGDNSRVGWNCQIMDTDFHYMRNIETGELTKTISKPIMIGKNNWFGNGCTIFKGFQTAEFVTIGSGTKCRGHIDEPYTIWGNDAKLIKLREGWCRDFTNDLDLYNLNYVL